MLAEILRRLCPIIEYLFFNMKDALLLVYCFQFQLPISEAEKFMPFILMLETLRQHV